MAYQGHDRSIDDLVSQTTATAKSLTVAELKNVLRNEGLTVSGIKSELQIRLIAHIQKAQHDNNRVALDRIRSRMTPGRATYGTSYPSPYSNHTPTSSLSPQFVQTPTRLPPLSNGFGMPAQRHPFQTSGVRFPDSPFYTIKYSLAEPKECRARETTRDTVQIRLKLNQTVISELQDPRADAKIMVFCAADDKPTEIAFPHQVELRCNGDEIKANLRGLKNKPGSTRPVDITHMIRRRQPLLDNVVEMTYAITTKDGAKQKFWLVVNLVHKKQVDALVQILRRGRSISIERVVREMQQKAADPDIVATSSIMSLKCPLSYMRIKTPCRGIGCRHNQCFDATSYLQLQEQAPTWTCPVCNKLVPWEHLILDLYMQNILESTSEETEEVTIEPDGRWHLGKEMDTPSATGNRKANPTPPDGDDSDEVLEIVEHPTAQSLKRDPHAMALTPQSGVRTPLLHTRDQSRAPSGTPGGTGQSGKRAASNVIDLTLSDDDDDQPPLKRQRPSVSSSSNSFNFRPPDQNRTGTPGGSGFSFIMPPPNPPAFDFDDRFGPTY